jgi:hypothetical protein
MRASRTRQVFSYLLLAGGALLLYWGGLVKMRGKYDVILHLKNVI